MQTKDEEPWMLIVIPTVKKHFCHDCDGFACIISRNSCICISSDCGDEFGRSLAAPKTDDMRMNPCVIFMTPLITYHIAFSTLK